MRSGACRCGKQSGECRATHTNGHIEIGTGILLTFGFADCNRGRVVFKSNAGYGSRSMNLTRLTQPAGLTCP